jgi:hypothetical protein
LYLLDADTIITADRDAYPLDRFPVFWEWLIFKGQNAEVKMPLEQYEEVVLGRGQIVDWLKRQDVREALLLGEEAQPTLVDEVTQVGYAPDLNEDEVEQIGQDPFLIAYAYKAESPRTVVTFETSAPSKLRANRKIPDVCRSLGVPCVNLYSMIKTLDFSTTWTPPNET